MITFTFESRMFCVARIMQWNCKSQKQTKNKPTFICGNCPSSKFSEWYHISPVRGRPYPNHFLIYKLDILTFNNCLILLTLRDCIPLSAHHYRVLIKRRVCIPPHTIWKNNGCMTLYLWPLYFIDNRSDMSIFVCVCVWM